MIATGYNQWQPSARAKPLRRNSDPVAYEVESLATDEVTALQHATRGSLKASAQRLREHYISQGVIVPLTARVADDGTTVFRNLAGAAVFRQGHLTPEMLAATHPAELEHAALSPRERTSEKQSRY
jgi:hypothetical protein